MFDLKNQAKQKIIEAVREKQGAKSIDIAIEAEVMFAVVKSKVSFAELVEVEYTLPGMSYRVKSFLLPGGSKFACAHEASSELHPLDSVEVTSWRDDCELCEDDNND